MAKKATEKKGTAKKAAPKKSPAKKATVKKGAAKKIVVKKAAGKKTASKKKISKKTVVKKAAPKKPLAKKATAKKIGVAKKTVAKKTPVKKAAVPEKIGAGKKPVVKKAIVKKIAPAQKNTIVKKAIVKKMPPIKKVVPKVAAAEPVHEQLALFTEQSPAAHIDIPLPSITALPEDLVSKAANIKTTLPSAEKTQSQQANAAKATEDPLTAFDKHVFEKATAKGDPQSKLRLSSVNKSSIKPSGKKPLWNK
jgi:Histone H1-like nucleoprotein HC2